MLSKYNIYVKEDEAIWIYNNYKKKIIQLSKEEYQQLNYNELENRDSKLYKRLIQYNIIYEGEDETKSMLIAHQQRLSKSGLNIMIMSSTACNFNCSYCYEEFVPKNIDGLFEKTFIEYLDQNVSRYSSLFIEWFGGEPLLAKNHVISIAKKAREICKKTNTPFLSSITTNGYYLDYIIFSELLDGNVIYFQVTIDGNKEWHDKYRPLKNGEGTYDVVFSNLLNIKRHVPNNRIFRLTIRNNVSNDNKEACIQFKKVFEESFGDDNRFQLFQFPIKDWGGKKIMDIKNQLIIEETLQLSYTENYRNDIFESIESSSCLAAKKNGYVIDPDYKVYKCNHYIQGKEIMNGVNMKSRSNVITAIIYQIALLHVHSVR